MALVTEFISLPLDQLRREAAVLKADGWRFVQTHAVSVDDGVDLYYTFMDMRDHRVVNYRVEGVKKGTPVPSITDMFLAAFVFENEAHELFGVDMRDIAIDFHGAMYAPAQSEPMTFITPEQKAAKEKAAKAAAAKAAKEAAAAGGQEPVPAGAPAEGGAAAAAPGKRVFAMTPERQARLDAKLPSLSPEKRAKVEAALAARAAEAEQASLSGTADSAGEGEGGGAPGESACAAKTEGRAPQQDATFNEGPAPEPEGDTVLESLLSAMDPGKAAKVRGVLGGRERDVPAGPAREPAAADPSALPDDEEIVKLLDMMDDAKAAKVVAALSSKGGN